MFRRLAAQGARLLERTTGVRLSLERHQLRFQRNYPPTDRRLRVVHITDLHMRKFGAFERYLARLARFLRPDVIVATGDYVETDNQISNAARFFERMADDVPVLAVLGNHDHDGCVNTTGLIRQLRAVGVDVLCNENRTLQVGTNKLHLIGLDDPATGKARFAEAAYGLSGDAANELQLLLSHTAQPFEEAAERGISLMLTGHTHGGQIFVPGISHALARMSFGIQYLGGLFKLNRTFLYVNRGVGTIGLPLRLWCPPELAVFDLQLGPKKLLGKPSDTHALPLAPNPS